MNKKSVWGWGFVFIGIVTITFNSQLTGAVVGVDSGIGKGLFSIIGLVFVIAGLVVMYSKKNQTLEDKLSKQVIGVSYRNPKITGRIIEDEEIVRQKYNLPPPRLRRAEPYEYIRRLEAIAKKNGIRIEKVGHLGAGALYDTGEKRIDINEYMFDDNNEKVKLSTDRYAKYLAHELVHALQMGRYPSMPIELKEYEAYLESEVTNDVNLTKPKTRKSIFKKIGLSSKSFNEQEKRIRQERD